MRRSSSFETETGAAPTPKSALTEGHKNRRLLLHFAGFMLFCCACGLLLSTVELPVEEAALREHKERSAEAFAIVATLVQNGHADASALDLLRDTCDLDLSEFHEPKWRFPGGFFFVVSIVTTIGYGNYVPVTPQGKLITCAMASCRPSLESSRASRSSSSTGTGFRALCRSRSFA